MHCRQGITKGKAMTTNHKKLYNIIIIVFFVIAAAAVVALSFAYNSIRPIIYGACIAYIFKPMCNVYTRLFYRLAVKKLSIPKSKKIAHYSGIVATYITWAIIIYIFLAAVLPSLIFSMINIVNNIPGILSTLNDYVNEILEGNETLLKYYNIFSKELSEYWNQNKQKVLEWVTSLAGGMISGIINTLTFIFNIIVGFIVSIYVLSSRKKLGAQAKLMVKSVFDRKTADLIIGEAAFADRMFSKYFVGSIIDSTIVGVVCFIGCTFLKMPYVMLVSFIVGVTNIIPFFGPYIGMFPSALIICTASPIKAVLFIVMMVLIQQVDGNILAPKIIGSNTGLPSFWVLFAILLFGGLFGFVGMIIGVPIFAVIYDVFGKLMRFCLQKRGQHEEIAKYEKEYLEEQQKSDKSFTKTVTENLKKITKSVRQTEEEPVTDENGYPVQSDEESFDTSSGSEPVKKQKQNKRNKTAKANKSQNSRKSSGVNARSFGKEREEAVKTATDARANAKSHEVKNSSAEQAETADSNGLKNGTESDGKTNRENAPGTAETEYKKTVQTEETDRRHLPADPEDEPWQMTFGDEL